MHRLGVVVRLILVMAMVSIAVAGVAIHLLYRTTLIEERTRLVVAAQSQARLLEAINRWEQADAARYPDHDHSSENALAIIVNAHDNYRGFSQTGEFTLARREGQNMVFLLRHRHSDLSQPAPVRFDAELAEPMRRALSGLSGVVVGLDYRGIQVLAAHEPVADLDWGIVAKIDVAEVRAPFVRAGLITGGIGLVIVLAGATLFVRIGAPLVRRLAESGERLQMALSAADVGTWRWDPLADRDTRDASFNRILGLETAESTRPVEDFFGRIHHEDRSAVEDALRVAVERRSPYATEFRIVRPGGETRWLRDQGKGHYSQNGEMIYMTGAVVDITERKRAEETLASTTSFLDTVVDMSPFAMWVSDRAGTVIRTNHALRKTLNLTNEHIAGKYNVFEDTNLQIQGVMPMVKAVFEKHEPARFSILWTAAEAGDVTFEGGHDLYIDVSMFPILNAEGELTNVVCQWVDITERKWAEEALQESKERLIAAQRIARMGDFTWDTGTGAVTWSDAMFDLLQYDQSEKLDFERVNADIHHPDDLERVTQWLNECVATGADQLTPNEYRLIRRDGGIIDVRTVGVIHHREGNSPLVFGTVYDITERKRAEEELRGERDRAQNYLDVAGVMFVAIDEHQRVTLINRKGCEILGLSEGEIIGANWFETFLPERDKQTVKDVFAQLIAGEVAPAEYFENPVVTKDGQERLIAWHNTMLRNAAGRIVGTLGSGEDITERKRAEEALRESEERLRQIAETIEDVFWITDWESHRTLFASRAYERIWDRSLRDLYADAQNWADAIHPEDGERAWESFVQLGEGGSYDEEYRIVRPDGSMRWIRDRGFPILDSSGQICRVAGIAQDVTEHKQAEEARRLERARMMSILDAIPDGVYIVSQQWDIEYVNPVIEREFGPVDGRKCYEYFHNRTVTCPWCRNAEVFAGKSVRWEWHSFKNNRDYDLFDTPFRNADGSVSKFEIFHDITERKRAEREVREANTRLLAHKEQERQRVEAEVERLRSELVNKTRLAAIGQVSASIGHELRNPLGAIRNAVYLLRRKATDSQAKRTNYISMIEQEINRANQTITDLMEMARPKHPHQQDIDLGEAIRDAAQRANIPEGVRLSIALEPDPFRTHADPSQMRQVLNNLITNAVQAVGNNGEISVDARRDSGYDEVQVRDTGPGVPEEDRERLFEPLFSTKAKGTGLGLTICRQIIERHGGTIEFVHPQGGNPAFLIRLPRRGTT